MIAYVMVYILTLNMTYPANQWIILASRQDGEGRGLLASGSLHGICAGVSPGNLYGIMAFGCAQRRSLRGALR